MAVPNKSYARKIGKGGVCGIPIDIDGRKKGGAVVDPVVGPWCGPDGAKAGVAAAARVRGGATDCVV
jgi:hypothetical protein